MSASYSGRVTRVITTDFPQYFAIITRIKQEVHVIGSEGGILISSVVNHVQAVFPPGALTKKIKVGLQVRNDGFVCIHLESLPGQTIVHTHRVIPGNRAHPFNFRKGRGGLVRFVRAG